eukprot:TRINITY_DN8549_c1_g1_i1.p1 TRINITY_DN8549_c1_g1~~TRINITY_DN8549_c1_g1_i1.p1  ORF type:complete len:247 (-),score=64.49 TRINITY_DN8549_c1_g1_i1:125-865(-)
MCFELTRAADGKAQARNLRTPPAGVKPPEPQPNMMQMQQMQMMGGCCAPGMRPMMPGQRMPGVVGQGMMPGGVAGRGPPVIKPMDRRRAWSPHAGSRSIRKSTEDPGEEGEGKKASDSDSSSSASSSSSKKKKKKKKKDKKSKKKKKSKSSSSHETLSSDSKSRSRSRKRKADEDDKPKSSPEIEQAKRDALAKLTALQSVEPKEERAKEWRKLLRNWHPDKNPDKKEVATEVFQFLQKGKAIVGL